VHFIRQIEEGIVVHRQPFWDQLIVHFYKIKTFAFKILMPAIIKRNRLSLSGFIK
jgi:hypothetical protein